MALKITPPPWPSPYCNCPIIVYLQVNAISPGLFTRPISEADFGLSKVSPLIRTKLFCFFKNTH